MSMCNGSGPNSVADFGCKRDDMIIPLAMRDLVVTAPSFSPVVMEGIEDRG